MRKQSNPRRQLNVSLMIQIISSKKLYRILTLAGLTQYLIRTFYVRAKEFSVLTLKRKIGLDGAWRREKIIKHETIKRLLNNTIISSISQSVVSSGPYNREPREKKKRPASYRDFDSPQKYGNDRLLPQRYIFVLVSVLGCI